MEKSCHLLYILQCTFFPIIGIQTVPDEEHKKEFWGKICKPFLPNAVWFFFFWNSVAVMGNFAWIIWFS